MNIVYILSATTPFGGATKSFLTLLLPFVEKGIKPIVVVPDTKGIYKDLNDANIETIAIKYRPNTYPDLNKAKDWILFLPRLIARRYINRIAVQKLTKVFRHSNISLIHTNVSVIDIGYRVANKLQIPHIYHVREYGDIDFGKHYFPTWASFHHTLHAPTSYSICITKGIQRHHGLENERKSLVIYNGISNKKQLCNQQEKNYFLYAGRIEPAKDLLFLLQAYKEYKKVAPHPTPLWIAGGVSDSMYYQKIQDFIACHQLQDSIIFLGPRSDIDTIMQEAKAIIIPSRFEAFGRCMAEAMFNGCIVTGRNTGGTKEQFDNGIAQTGKEIGLRFSSIEDLQQQLQKLDTLSPIEKKNLRENAFKAVASLYSEDTYIQQIYHFYQDILHGKKD